ALLRVGLRVHVRLWDAFLRHRVVLPPGHPGDLRLERCRVPRLLALPVRLRRHLLDDHVGRDDRTDRIRRRSRLQRGRVGLHLPDLRSLGVGTRRLAGDDGERRQLLPRARHELPRLRRLDGRPMLPHDLTIATVGGFILWFGWYGFNPGSTLSAMDFEGIGRIAANTTLAACAAGLSAMFYAYPKTKTSDVSFTVHRFPPPLLAIPR